MWALLFNTCRVDLTRGSIFRFWGLWMHTNGSVSDFPLAFVFASVSCGICWCFLLLIFWGSLLQWRNLSFLTGVCPLFSHHQYWCIVFSLRHRVGMLVFVYIWDGSSGMWGIWHCVCPSIYIIYYMCWSLIYIPSEKTLPKPEKSRQWMANKGAETTQCSKNTVVFVCKCTHFLTAISTIYKRPWHGVLSREWKNNGKRIRVNKFVSTFRLWNQQVCGLYLYRRWRC